MITGQTNKEKAYYEKIVKKNRERQKLPRTYQESELTLKEHST